VLHACSHSSGESMMWARVSQHLLAVDWGLAAEVWSSTSWTELRREAMACDRWNQLHPDQEQRVPYLTEKLNHSDGPVLAASDFMRAVPDQIAPWVPQEYASVGTDGFGRSDLRPVLRRHFGVDGPSIAAAVLWLLSRGNDVTEELVRN